MKSLSQDQQNQVIPGLIEEFDDQELISHSKAKYISNMSNNIEGKLVCHESYLAR